LFKISPHTTLVQTAGAQSEVFNATEHGGCTSWTIDVKIYEWVDEYLSTK